MDFLVEAEDHGDGGGGEDESGGFFDEGGFCF